MPTAIAVIGIGASLYGAKKGSDAAKDAASANAAAVERQRIADEKHAAAILEQSVQEAGKIRAESIVFRGRQIAQAASSGVLVGNGSAQDMVDQTIRLSERDAYTTLYNGEKGYLNTMEQSRSNVIAGRAQTAAYKAQGQASLLAGVGTAFMSTYSLMSATG